ncbi:hypothetical protein FB45DRAFT_913952 [Roridomyces roridus]|uniref:Uncharacterized protein n=1 Tax=Roridomyces roridus TaxID=1738132 RepID=A0AAD7FMZ6_9AGAR|nr:hypothetical protein FB45DRAFT_913952 [Roridomyces roridus]
MVQTRKSPVLRPLESGSTEKLTFSIGADRKLHPPSQDSEEWNEMYIRNDAPRSFPHCSAPHISSTTTPTLFYIYTPCVLSLCLLSLLLSWCCPPSRPSLKDLPTGCWRAHPAPPDTTPTSTAAATFANLVTTAPTARATPSAALVNTTPTTARPPSAPTAPPVTIKTSKARRAANRPLEERTFSTQVLGTTVWSPVVLSRASLARARPV